MYKLFAYNVADDGKEYRTAQSAANALQKKVKAWCKENDINLNDTDYKPGDDSFFCGIEEQGVYILKVVEIPQINNKMEELLWQTKWDLQFVDAAVEDYKFSLTDCCATDSVYSAVVKIDQVLQIISQMSAIVQK